MQPCSLCAPDLAPQIALSKYWVLVLNTNQNLLGKCFWVLRQHQEDVRDLTPEAWTDLHQQMIRAADALTQLFQPDHFNYAFLQNQDRHIHLHIIPRYAQARSFAGDVFEDPDYPSHYSVPALSRRLSEEHFGALAEAFRKVFV